jgi:regulatory protein YycI of two-component signal transduction system YycFG
MVNNPDLSENMSARVGSMERTLHGYNGYIGLVGDVRDVQRSQESMKQDICTQEKLMNDPEKGVMMRMALLENFAVDAKEFIKDFRGTVNKLILAVLGTVIGGVLLQILLNYIITKGKVP